MRILMAVPKYPFPVVGGLERQAHELARALVRRGHVVYAVSGRFDPSQHNDESIDGVRVQRLKWIEFRPTRFLLVPFGLVRLLVALKRDVDLVHVHNISWFGAFITALAKILGLPVVAKLPNIGASGIPGLRRQRWGALRVRLLRTSDAIVAMAPESVAELATIGYPAARVLRVTNGISVLAKSVETACHNRVGPVTAVFTGRFLPQKGLVDLLHAWSTVKSCARCSVRLRLIGEGEQLDELQALALALELGESLKFSGYCSDVPAELTRADVFVLPSYVEGNSNSILEAMRAGLPVVATRVGGALIQVGPRGERFLVAPGDREELAKRLVELIEDESLRLRLGAAMRARVESMFDIDRVAATYEQAYESILSGRGDDIGAINPMLFVRDEGSL
jgi:glycosyltransferase involved in cell wall biosynthesis